MIGTIVWIHPKRRYYIIQYDCGYRESFLFRDTPPKICR
nr:MAG TPA: cold shock protein [Caudoviricetes sp.]